MAYAKPDIKVTQIFTSIAATALTPNLLPALAGEVYQVEKKLEAGTYTGASATLAYPSKKSGAVIDTTTYTPSVYIRHGGIDYDVTTAATIDATDVDLGTNVEYEIQASSSTGAIVSYAFTDVNALFITNGVAAGDFVKIGANYYEIASVDSETQVTMLVAPGDAASQTYTIERRLLGKVYISYRASRTDSAVSGGYLEIGSLSDLQTLFGVNAVATPENPLGYGMFLAYSAGNTRVGGYGVDPTASSATEYAAALDIFKTKTVYHLVSLTMNTSYQDLFISHANTMSTAAKKKERRVYIGRDMQDSDVVDSGANGATNVGGTVFTATGQNFLTTIKAGDKIKVGSETEVVISAVTDNENLALETAVTGSLTSQAFTITRYYAKDQQVSNAVAVASGIANMRVTLVGPSKVDVDVNGTTTTVDSFYLAAIKAGMQAGNNIGRPLINKSAPGILGVNKGSDYFTEDQLDAIAGSGWQLFVQDAAGAPCYCRDELTTDQSSGPKFGQEIEVIARDYASYTFRDTLRPQIGNFNITEDTLSILRVSLEGAIAALKKLEYKPFSAMSIGKFEASTSNPGRVEASVTATQNDPYTGMDIDFII